MLDLLALPLLVMLALAVLGPAVTAQFVLPDDHGILALDPTTLRHPQIPRPPTATERAFTEDPARGRFLPLSVFIRYAQIDLLGMQPAAWPRSRLGWALVPPGSCS